MDGRPISAAALSQAGLGLLTTDIGRTRLVEVLRAHREARRAEAENEAVAAARGQDPARATRP